MSASRNLSISAAAFLSLALMLTLGAAPQAPPPTGLVGHWKLDEMTGTTTAADALGALNGVYYGSSTPSTSVPASMVPYPDPNSRNFDGVDDYVSVANASSLQITGNITIAFWMNKASEAGDWQRLVGKGQSGPRNYGVWEESQGGQRILFQIYPGILNMTSAGTIPSDPGMAAANWRHVTCIVDGANGYIYLQGALNAGPVAKGAGTPATSADPLTFGYAGFHTYFPGRMDDVRIYNRALTAAEVGILFNGLPGPSGLTGTAPTPNSVSLNWTAPPSAATSYNVLRSQTSGGPYSTIATGVMTTSYVDNSVLDDSQYYYRVTAILSVGESAQSNQFGIRTPLLPPRFDDHEEGLFDDNCNCASTGPSSPLAIAGALALLALALVALRR